MTKFASRRLPLAIAGTLAFGCATALRADEFTVTASKFGPASTPNTLAWAIAQANASSAADNVISIAEGLQIKVDNAAFFGVLQLARITRDVRIEGNNATLVGNPSFVTSSGDLITKDNPMAWIKVISHSEATGLLKRQYDAAVKRAGRIWNIVSIQSQLPEVMRDSMRLYSSIMYGPSPLTRAQREMLAVVTSQHNDCHY